MTESPVATPPRGHLGRGDSLDDGGGRSPPPPPAPAGGRRAGHATAAPSTTGRAPACSARTAPSGRPGWRGGAACDRAREDDTLMTTAFELCVERRAARSVMHSTGSCHTQTSPEESEALNLLVACYCMYGWPSLTGEVCQHLRGDYI